VTLSEQTDKLAPDTERRARYRVEAEATAAASASATRSELIWGSYDLYEALHVLTGRLDPADI
jgi:hypothetical protein